MNLKIPVHCMTPKHCPIEQTFERNIYFIVSYNHFTIYYPISYTTLMQNRPGAEKSLLLLKNQNLSSGGIKFSACLPVWLNSFTILFKIEVKSPPKYWNRKFLIKSTSENNFLTKSTDFCTPRTAKFSPKIYENYQGFCYQFFFFFINSSSRSLVIFRCNYCNL